MRKKRNVRRVMGWLLSFQLSDPGAGVCWAVSIACRAGGGRFAGRWTCRWLHVALAEGSGTRRRVGVCGREPRPELPTHPSPHVIGYLELRVSEVFIAYLPLTVYNTAAIPRCLS
jgi:hypothetical protein